MDEMGITCRATQEETILARFGSDSIVAGKTFTSSRVTKDRACFHYGLGQLSAPAFQKILIWTANSFNVKLKMFYS